MKIDAFIWSAKLGKTLVIKSIGCDLVHEDVIWDGDTRRVYPKKIICKKDQVVLMEGKFNEKAVFWVMGISEVWKMISEGKAYYNSIPRNWSQIKQSLNSN